MHQRTYGKIYRSDGRFHLEVDSQVRVKLKRLFLSTAGETGPLRLSDSRGNCQDLEMIMTRWPLTCDDGTIDYILERAEDTRKMGEEMDLVRAGKCLGEIPMLLPLRDYQKIVVEMVRRQGFVLCGDTLGLGKTPTGIGCHAAGLGPTIVIAQTHLLKQWRDQFRKFLGTKLRIHIQKTGKGNVPTCDVLIMSYNMLPKWHHKLDGFKLLLFDEAQELRHRGTQKYAAAFELARTVSSILPLTATPIINYGGEIFSLLDLMSPGCLGSEQEFNREWCSAGSNGKQVVRDPIALGHHIADQNLFIRRTRKDVGKELPPVNRVVVDIPFNKKVIEQMNRQSLQLAEAILSSNSSFNEKGQAARQLDLKLRQATGIAKAPQCALAIADLVESGERVLVSGWHREVYEILTEVFKHREIPCFLYTGTENSTQKNKAAENFMKGEKPGVLLMSMRSGAGLDGLQEVCSVVFHVELDWSRKIMDQLTGRLNRDGQRGRVTEVFAVADGGSDPLISGILGLTEEQALGIVDPKLAVDQPGEGAVISEAEVSRGAALAQMIVDSLGGKSAKKDDDDDEEDPAAAAVAAVPGLPAWNDIKKPEKEKKDGWLF